MLNLRNVAKKLSLKSSKVINPVSLLHSNKISDSKLNNIPADVFEPYVSEKVKNGTNEFLILPLFFGRSAAIYEYLPQRMEDIQQECGQFDLKIAPPLVDLDDANNDADGNPQTSNVYGSQGLDTDSISSFTAFADLTSSDVQGWVEAALGADEVTALKANLDAQIAEKITPTSVTKTIGS